MRKIITRSAEETRSIATQLAKEMTNGGILCLSGNLGAGKTTFAQGFLKALKIKGPYTSPTFSILKKYSRKNRFSAQNVYHIDAYRINAKALLDLDWMEIIQEKNVLILLEWPEKVLAILPPEIIWLKFSRLGENQRQIQRKSLPNTKFRAKNN